MLKSNARYAERFLK